ncbi:DUF2568 domain-containing protein [Paenibacillus sp. J31TS4]|uniref:DUF2568 domain-containing protein n=1 Tax=Paenibacillus sp. J31TS4 TaxID=2807195 RepID=UPI001BCC46D6|nr:DUF2568 domain-containing protein [Paenibacillus sp. J31TS4]
MKGILALNLLLRFGLELAALGLLAYGSYRLGLAGPARWALAIGAPLAAAALWGAFIAPRASWLAPEPLRFLLELVVFGGAAYAVSAAGHPHLGLAFLALALLNRLLITIWHQ